MDQQQQQQKQQHLIRSLILYEFKLGNNPKDVSEKIQKIYGFNFETRLTSIEHWFRQFSLGDECLDDLPTGIGRKPRTTTINNQFNNSVFNTSITTTTTSTRNYSLNSNNNTPTKLLLLYELKDQVELLYRKLNTQDSCLKAVDRFLKHYKNDCIPSSFDENIMKSSFLKNYQILRRNCRKLSRQINQSNFYQTLYDNLYCVSVDEIDNIEEEEEENTKKKKKPVVSVVVGNGSKTKLIKSLKNKPEKNKTKSPKNLGIRKRRKPSRPVPPRISEKKWPKLPSQVKTEEETETLENKSSLMQCLVDGCSYVAANQKLFTIHQSTHADPILTMRIKEEDGTMPATCDKCDKVLKNRYRLKIHIQEIHERGDERLNCPLQGCDASYANQSGLRKHIRIVHTKDAKVYRCTWDDCSYVTHSGDMLKKHINVHTGERPYKCVWPGCVKAFKSDSALAFHKSIHRNERQYKCHWPECGYACNISSNLRKHVAIHERKQMQLIAVSVVANNAVATNNNNTTVN